MADIQKGWKLTATLPKGEEVVSIVCCNGDVFVGTTTRVYMLRTSDMVLCPMEMMVPDAKASL